MDTLIDFSGKKYIVTGGSAGIGRQTAISLSQLGAQLILVARREEKLQEAIRDLEGEGHTYYVADMSIADDIEKLFKQIEKEQGKIDGMVYAAGIRGDIPLMQLKPDKLKKVFDVNFFGFVECVRQICKKGRYNEGMKIVGISSMAALGNNKAHVSYSSSKAAMNCAVKHIAPEIYEKGIRINAVAPGAVETEMYQDFLELQEKEYLDRVKEKQYLGLIKIENVVSTITFLLSPAAFYINGVTLPVNAGLITY